MVLFFFKGGFPGGLFSLFLLKYKENVAFDVPVVLHKSYFQGLQIKALNELARGTKECGVTTVVYTLSFWYCLSLALWYFSTEDIFFAGSSLNPLIDAINIIVALICSCLLILTITNVFHLNVSL